jgi:Flp pilus assembly pilin Flp
VTPIAPALWDAERHEGRKMPAFPAAPKKERTMKSFFKNFCQEESGQDLIEYTLLMAFVALASAAIFISAGGSVSTIWTGANVQLANAATAAS